MFAFKHDPIFRQVEGLYNKVLESDKERAGSSSSDEKKNLKDAKGMAMGVIITSIILFILYFIWFISIILRAVRYNAEGRLQGDNMHIIIIACTFFFGPLIGEIMLYAFQTR